MLEKLPLQSFKYINSTFSFADSLPFDPNLYSCSGACLIYLIIFLNILFNNAILSVCGAEFQISLDIPCWSALPCNSSCILNLFYVASSNSSWWLLSPDRRRLLFFVLDHHHFTHLD
jgi:hypothetical protein